MFGQHMLLAGAASGGGGVPWDFSLADYDYDQTNPNGDTYASLDFPDPHAERYALVIHSLGGNNRSLSSATIGGAAANIIGSSSDSNHSIGASWLKVPTGTTLTIENDWDGNGSRGGVALFRVVGQAGADLTPDVTNIGGLSLSLPDNGFGLYVIQDGGSTSMSGEDTEYLDFSMSNFGIVHGGISVTSASVESVSGSNRESLALGWVRNV